MAGVTGDIVSAAAEFEYRIEKVSGVFKRRVTKYRELHELCERMGESGWELVAVTYDWFVVTYVLFFRRRRVARAG
jgi:hypothetical protein